MVNFLARAISIVFHPLLMASYLTAIFLLVFPAALYPIKAEMQLSFLGLLFLLTFVLPGINIALFRVFGIISSFSMEDRSERIRPFLLILILYGFFTYLLYTKSRLSIGDNLFNLILIIDALVLTSLVVTFFYKVSIHSLAIWGIVGIFLPLNKVVEDGSMLIPTLGAIFVAGLIMSSRLQLNAHTPREVLTGALAGFAIGFFGMLLLFT
jgi:membrane-associated phospholipid phosphatase